MNCDLLLTYGKFVALEINENNFSLRFPNTLHKHTLEYSLPLQIPHRTKLTRQICYNVISDIIQQLKNAMEWFKKINLPV